MFEKPENTLDISKSLANLSYVKVPNSCHDQNTSNSHRYHEMLIAVWLGSDLH